MSSGLISMLLPNLAVDAVAVYDQDFNQVFPGARPIKIVPKPSSKLMDHPVEIGTIITDNRILNPNEVDVSFIVPGRNYQNVYQQIKQHYTKATLLVIQSRADTYFNMVIKDMPHEETSEMFDALAVAITFRQVQFVSATYGTLPARKVANKTQASTVQRGNQQPKTVEPAPRASILSRIGRAIKP